MTRRPGSGDERGRAGRYEIRVQGHLDARWGTRFEGLRLRHEADGLTVIDGLVADQAALHAVLHRVRDIGLPLISVTRIDQGAGDPHAVSPPPTDPEPGSARPTHSHLPSTERNDDP